MISTRLVPIALALGLAAGSAAAESPLVEQLAPLTPLVGKTFRSTTAGEKASTHVQTWERAMNGQAVRVLHSINDGDYGGETIFYWDESTRRIVFFYFTAAGFFTSGALTPVEGGFDALETPNRSVSGITEVRGSWRLLPDGRLQARSSYFKDGAWGPEREEIFTEAPDARVVFRQ